MRPTTDLQRTVAPFRVVSEFQPSGDQPQAIAELAARPHESVDAYAEAKTPFVRRVLAEADREE